MAVLQEQSLREAPKPDSLSSGNLQAGHAAKASGRNGLLDRT